MQKRESMENKINKKEKRAIIIGATSGIGQEVARLLLAEGWQLGIAGRREENLKAFQQLAPERIHIEVLDICQEGAEKKLESLIQKVGGMDLYFHASGIGKQNKLLTPEIEIKTLQTNGTGFVRMVTHAFNYFTEQGKGHLAIISSIAGTKGLGIAPAYSASKRFQNTYIDALEQLAHINKKDIQFTDIRPGFVATDLLNGGKNYPMLMKKEDVAREIVKGLKKKKRVLVVDWRYRWLVAFWKLIPNWLWKYLPVYN